jgi:hypothetical protein
MKGRLRILLNPYPREKGKVKSLPASREGPQGGVDPLFKSLLKLLFKTQRLSDKISPTSR